MIGPETQHTQICEPLLITGPVKELPNHGKHSFAWIVSDNACGKSHPLCYTGDLYYPQTQPWEDCGVQAEDERAPSNQRTRAGQRALCGGVVLEDARQNCLHWGKAGERKVMTDAKGKAVKA